MPNPAAPVPSRLPWPPLLLFAALLAALLLGWVLPLPWPGLNDRPAQIVGYAILAAGIGLMLWSIATFATAGANVMPHRPATALLTHGPFRIWRNPIYMADVLILAGLAQATGNVWFVILAVVFALAVLKLAIVPEETHLEAKFGQAYIDYKARTRRWF